jgi:exosome complex exonuclease DIS3/RRP44
MLAYLFPRFKPPNIHRRETAVVREDNETPNDRNDRGNVYYIPLDYQKSNTCTRHSQIHGLVWPSPQAHQTANTRAVNPTSDHRIVDRGCCKPGEGSKGRHNRNVRLVSSTASLTLSALMCDSVRQYVEGMANATQLLDLLAAEGSEEIEPTMAVASRRALYSEVCRYFLLL